MAHFDNLCTADCKCFFSAPPTTTTNATSVAAATANTTATTNFRFWLSYLYCRYYSMIGRVSQNRTFGIDGANQCMDSASCQSVHEEINSELVTLLGLYTGNISKS